MEIYPLLHREENFKNKRKFLFKTSGNVGLKMCASLALGPVHIHEWNEKSQKRSTSHVSFQNLIIKYNYCDSFPEYLLTQRSFVRFLFLQIGKFICYSVSIKIYRINGASNLRLSSRGIPGGKCASVMFFSIISDYSAWVSGTLNKFSVTLRGFRIELKIRKRITEEEKGLSRG